MSLTAIKAAALLALGFMGGVLGISLYSNSTLAQSIPQLLADTSGPVAANACVSDVQADEDEIFFLSCGGIF
jgi:hypothetical protein